MGQTRQELHFRVKHINQHLFTLSTIYCLPSLSAKTTLWENLLNFSKLVDTSWLVAGDFNQIGDLDEKQGGRTPPITKCLNFKTNISKCQLNNLGYHGPKYTWSNKRFTNKNTLIQERLDRVLGNDA